jgi:signal-transduction protein with cAMP-binding, CBS, and nucleotidyltransferase domain
VPFFANYSGKTLIDICGQLHQKVYKEGDIVFKKGDYGDILYVFMKGKVGVYVDDATE